MSVLLWVQILWDRKKLQFNSIGTKTELFLKIPENTKRSITLEGAKERAGLKKKKKFKICTWETNKSFLGKAVGG